MTSTQTIAKDAYCMMSMTSHRPLRQAAADPRIERMDALELDGVYDRDADGLRHSREGRVGDTVMMVQVATMGQDTLLIFWALDTGKQQRVLVTAGDLVYMDVGERAILIGAGNKYAEPVSKILAARAN